MAEKFKGKDKNDLIEYLKGKKVIKSPEVETVMLDVDRGNYCKLNPYEDGPQMIGFGLTISAPRMHAHVLECLNDKLKDGTKALDIGFGSGYLTVCMALLLNKGQKGVMVGMDRIPDLVAKITEDIKKDKPDLLESKKIRLIVGDGLMGYEAEAPYDVIHVGVAVPTVPQLLIDQLNLGGRLLIPVGPRGQSQTLQQIDKLPNGMIKVTSLMGISYEFAKTGHL